MKRILVGSLIVLMVIVLAGPALAGPYHTSTGVVTNANGAKVIVLTRVDLSGAPDQSFLVTKATEVLGLDGQPHPITVLQAGDYVRVDCLARPDGQFEIHKITVLALSTGYGF